MTSAVSPPGATAASTAPQGQVFPADASQVAAAREFLSGILAGGPVAEEAVLCLSDLSTRERMLLVWVS